MAGAGAHGGKDVGVAGLRLQTGRAVLRPITRADLPQIQPWYAEAAVLACSDTTLDERLAAAKLPQRRLLLIATADDPAPIGLLDYRIGFPAKGWLAMGFLALAAGRRGWGYGSEAVRLVEESAGATRFLADVSVHNGLGLYFWLRLGYRPANVNEALWHSSRRDGIIAMVRDNGQDSTR